MSSTRQTILQALREVRLIDPHSHINPHQPAATTLADLLGYHYYTELVHSAGTPKAEIESSGISPRELVGRLVKGLPHLTNTAQHAWLVDICQRFFGFADDTIDESNWESLYDSAETTMQIADWADVVLEKSNVEAVFLTNDFDDKLTGFDTQTYIPCLRTDDLVFHLSKSEVRDRLAVCSGIDIDGSLKSLRDSLEQRFEHFVARGARACAISLPPDFSPAPVSDGRASTALDAILRHGPSADASHKVAMAKRVFWTIVELCDQFKLPMDLMIGVNRGVYAEGVYQGRDLYDSRVSLIQYRELFNSFPDVKFPISVLASVTNQELVSYAWIFPNVITNGHWWYSNTPSFIRRDAAARLEAVPRNKQIGYYSDAYKLEFIAPKFEMYRRILAGILMDDFVIERDWSEEQAIALGRQILRGNVDTIFPELSKPTAADVVSQDYWSEDSVPNVVAPIAVAGALVAADPFSLIDEPTASAAIIEYSNELPLSDSTVIEWAPESQATETIFESEPMVESEPSVESAIEGDSLELLDDDRSSADDIFGFGQEDDVADKPADPNSTLDNVSGFSFDPEPNDLVPEPVSAAVQYFRADDVPPSELVEIPGANELGADGLDAPIGLYADPATGELTWPVTPTDNESDEQLEETYLIPEEPEAAAAEPETPDDFEIVDFDDLELTPIEDDSELLLSADEIDDDQVSFDPDQTVDFESKEPKHE